MAATTRRQSSRKTIDILWQWPPQSSSATYRGSHRDMLSEELRSAAPSSAGSPWCTYPTSTLLHGRMRQLAGHVIGERLHTDRSVGKAG